MDTTKPLFPAEKYTFRVAWSEEDRQYVGLCTEFPSLSHLDALSPQGALNGIIDLVGDVISDMINKKEDVPAPICLTTLKPRSA